MLHMFQSNVSSVNAYIWMLDAHAHAMQSTYARLTPRVLHWVGGYLYKTGFTYI